MTNKLDFAQKFDVWWWSNISEIKSSADFIFKKIYKNPPDGFKKHKLKNHLKVILTNLHVCHAKNNKLYLAISMDKSKYKTSRRFKKIFLDYRYVVFLINFLVDDGYLEYHKGVNFGHFKRMSRVKSTQKLLRLFRRFRTTGGKTLHRQIPIILRDKNKNQIDFDLNELEVKNFIQNVNKINKCLSVHCVNAMVPTVNYIDFMKEYSIFCGYDKYTRIFNNSSFKQGGRFYGHWSQNIKSDYRKFITIDGEATVELDYSCLHLYILYCREGIKPPQGDLYEVIGIDNKYRKIIKKSVNIIINAESEKSALQAIHQESLDFIDRTGLIPPRPKVILEAIRETHQTIQKYFCSNYGVFLQFMDSQIAEEILLDLAANNICCLCIHDSFIVSKKHKEQLYHLMIDKFIHKFRYPPRISIK